MAVGDVYKGNLTSWIDEEFGYKIIKPIEQDRNRGMYFTSNCFCNDNKNMIISAIRDGMENFYLLNFDTGDYIQLTDKPNLIIAKAYFDKKRNKLYYCDEYTIYCVDIDDLNSRVIYETQNQLGSIAITCDGKYLISSCEYPYKYKNNDHEDMVVDLYRMFKINLETGSFTPILHRNFEIDHIQCSPTNPDEIMFCARGYFCTHHRIWTTNIDGTKGGATGPEQPNEHRTHEYFTPDGKKIAYHGKFYKLTEEERFVVNRGHTWGIMNKDGSEDRYYRCPNGMQAGHSSMSFDQNLIVADGNGFISLLDLNDDTMEANFNPIFRHKSSMSGNFVHPHPSFSNDDRYIVFCTDFEGQDHGNIYLLDLKSK